MAKSFRNTIFSSLGGFFTTNDNYRHAIVGTTEGKIFEIFFNPQQGKGQAIWPHDTLSFLQRRGYSLPVASSQALSLYRREHQHIEEAFQAYLQAQRPS